MRFVARCGLGPPFWTLRPSILGAFGAQAAVATAGESPKFSFFGIAGNANTRAPGAGIERTPQKKTNPGEGARGHGRGGRGWADARTGEDRRSVVGRMETLPLSA